MNTENVAPFLRRILVRAAGQLEESKQQIPEEELRRRLADAPPTRSFSEALTSGFGLIAELKVKSPSAGAMRRENVVRAPQAYEESQIVKAISVLTNFPDFGMKIDRLQQIRSQTTKPVLRKDFIFDRYQVLEARAFGADAILLMANILSEDELRDLGQLAFQLNMEVLFESHTNSEIKKIPEFAKVWGINCRKLDSRSPWAARYWGSRALRHLFGFHDLSVKSEPLKLVRKIPAHAIKVAESGLTPERIVAVRDKHKFNAALVGNSLLLSKIGVDKMLTKFETALSESAAAARYSEPSTLVHA